MIDLARVYLEKARENLAAAESEYPQGRYNSCGSRAYYACFQAAVYALMRSGIQPPASSSVWGHEFVQAQFNGQLVARRKMYSGRLRDTLRENHTVRIAADYGLSHVGEIRAARALSRAGDFVDAIESEGGRSA